MKLVRWRRFTWDLSKLPPLESSLPAQYHIRRASREDAKSVHHVITCAFSLDSEWSDAYIIFRDRLEIQLEHAFAREPVPALVVTHGQRIIAASAINTDVDAESNLISGPCVSVEYRNRGLGSALLHGTLKQMQQAGLTSARGICKDTAPTAKFVYPKFGSTQQPHDLETQMAET